MQSALGDRTVPTCVLCQASRNPSPHSHTDLCSHTCNTEAHTTTPCHIHPPPAHRCTHAQAHSTPAQRIQELEELQEVGALLGGVQARGEGHIQEL